MTTIAETFRRVYGPEPNFMTPTILNYGKRGRMVWELSHGTGFRGDGLYGVTVIELPNTKRHDLSTCFRSYEAARKYIRNDFRL